MQYFDRSGSELPENLRNEIKWTILNSLDIFKKKWGNWHIMSINYKVENNFYNEADPHQPDTGQLHWKLDMQYKKQWKRKSWFLEPVLWIQSRPFLAGAV